MNAPTLKQQANIYRVVAHALNQIFQIIDGDDEQGRIIGMKVVDNFF